MKNLKYFLMFYHAPRAGSTLLTAILNANPNCMISNQQFILNNIGNKSIKEIFNLIREGSTPGHFKPTTQIPHVPKKEITVIGDKTGHRSLLLLEKNPMLLGELKNKVKIPVKSILIVRNPFDNLSTYGKLEYEIKVKKGIKTTQKKELDIVIDEYARLNDTIAKLKRSEDILTINHESVILKMHNTLEEISNFLEIDFDPVWRDNVRNSVWKKPRLTRNSIKWGIDQKRKVKNIIEAYPWLYGYEYGGCPKC
jgi:hypothetical protein